MLRVCLFFFRTKEANTWCFNNSSSCSKHRQRSFFSLHSFECSQMVYVRFIFSRSLPFKHSIEVCFCWMCVCTYAYCTLCSVCMTMVYREICIRLCRLLDYLLLSLFLHIRKIANLVRIIIYGTQILSHAQTHTHWRAHTMLRFNFTSLDLFKLARFCVSIYTHSYAQTYC